MSGIIIPVRPMVQAAGLALAPPVRPDAPSPALRQPEPLPMATALVGRGRRRAVVAVAIAGFVLMSVQLGFSAVFANRIMPGVAVANVALGGLTKPQAQARLAQALQGYSFNLVAVGNSFHLTPAQAGISYNLSATLDQAYLAGRNHPLTWLVASGSVVSRSLGFSYDVDSPTQQALATKIATATGQAPVDATVVVQNGVPTVQPDKNGRGLDPSAIVQAIDAAAVTAGQPAPLQPTVLTARIRSADTTSAITTTNQLLATSVTITYQGKSFEPTLAQRGQWIIHGKSPPNQPPALIPKVDPAAVKTYLQAIAPQINIAPVTQKVNVQNGVSQAYQAGQNGIALDADSLAATIATAVANKQPLTTAAPTTTVPFQTQYNNSVPLPYDQYIEINLSDQHLWAYQDHQVVYDSPVTSGATGAGFPTATGLFSILSKQTDRHLVGYQYGPAYNYDVFVQYWMQFYEGFGLHDASWRSSFGGPDYYYDGSHGCVNLPLATAAWLYGWTSVGTPVWVHN